MQESDSNVANILYDFPKKSEVLILCRGKTLLFAIYLSKRNIIGNIIGHIIGRL